ncbi:MAG: S8 family serine peptidase [Bacillota bacterium]
MRVKKPVLLLIALFFIVTLAGPVCQSPGETAFLNDRSREIVGSDMLSVSGFITTPGLTGKGQVVAVADSGIDKGSLEDIHPDLAAEPGKKPKIIMLKSLAGRSVPDDPLGHGTHMVGTIAGSGKASDGKYMGIAPDAGIYFQAILDENGNAAPPTDIDKLFLPAYQAGARIHVDAWGSGPDRYSGNAMKADSFMLNHPDFLVIFGAGNSGPGRASLTSEANSKNALVVGASVSPRPALDFSSGGTLDTAGFSSRGPAGDGRIKPDLTAPGTSVISTKSSLVKGNLPDNNDYIRMQGTSMAAAVAAGSTALLREFLQSEMALADPMSSSLKAALINGARTGEDGPSKEGFGVLDLGGTVLALKEKSMLLAEETGGLAQGETKTYSYTVKNPGEPLKVTLAWTDPAGELLSEKTLVNNLDLVVTGPGGNMYQGNGFLGRGPDDVNNVEQVYIKNPPPGEYQIQVRASELKKPVVLNPQKSGQDFSLVYGQPLSTGIVREVAGKDTVRLYDGNSLSLAGKKVGCMLDGSLSQKVDPEPGYRIYYGPESVYVVGRLWKPESVLFREGIGGRIWYGAGRGSLEGGYYQSGLDRGVNVNGSYTLDLSRIPSGVGLEAKLDGLTQTLWGITTGYRLATGVVDRVVQGEDGSIQSIRLLNNEEDFRFADKPGYIYSDTYEGIDPMGTVFGADSLDGLGEVMPGQQVTLVISPFSGRVSSVLVKRSVISGYVERPKPGDNKIVIDGGQELTIFDGARVQKDRNPSKAGEIAAGDYITAVVLPGTEEIIGIEAYSNVVYGQVLFSSGRDNAVYINDYKNSLQALKMTPETEVRRWGLETDVSTLTSGTWIRAVLVPGGKEIWRMDVAELLEDEQKVLVSANNRYIETSGGGVYRVSECVTRITKDGYPVAPEDLKSGESITVVSLLAPAPYKKVAVAVRARGTPGVEKPLLLTTLGDQNGYPVLSGQTNGSHLYIWHENGTREDVSIQGWQGLFYRPLRFLDNEESVTVVAVDAASGAVTGKKITRPEITGRGLTDVSGHWAEKVIVSTVAGGIMAGYGDGTFRPDNPVSVSELKLILGGITGLKGGVLDPAVLDISWPSGRGITRGEFMLIVKSMVRDPGTVPADYRLPFRDCVGIREEEMEAIAWGCRTGIIKGKSPSSFGPGDYLTRAEAAVIVQHLLKNLLVVG